MSTLPDRCLTCTNPATGEHRSLLDDPWHWLSCNSLKMGEVSNRHNAVADTVGRVAGLVGAQLRREVKGLDPHSNQRPDLQLVFPGRMVLTDVVCAPRQCRGARWHDERNLSPGTGYR
jgi:hypothetical protein